MKLSEIQNIAYKEKTFFVLEACLLYKKLNTAKLAVSKNENINKVKDSIVSKSLDSLKSLSIFETILGLLTQDQSLIIEEEYIKNNINSLWYKDYWSKTTYYKLKHEAINQFLYLLYA